MTQPGNVLTSVRNTTLLLLSILCSVPMAGESSLLATEFDDWVEGTAGKDDGATRDYYNRAARLPWRNLMGDWHDADDVAQGDVPLSITTASRQDLDNWVQWDVTGLVGNWRRGVYPNQGLMLRRIAGDRDVHFPSRDHANVQLRPQLVLTTDAGTLTLAPTVDTYLEPSTYRCMGDADSLRVGGRNHALLRFDLADLPEAAEIRSASLRLHISTLYGSGETTIGVFRCSQGHYEPPAQPLIGLAAAYDRDQGIDQHPKVIFSANFEPQHWAEAWTHVSNADVIDRVAEDPARKFEPLVGNALRVRMAEGANTALNTIFKFQAETGEEPEELYFRYYLRLADDWNQTIEGGKMPGISGTYNASGWGGRKSDGTSGWSARGSFSLTVPEDNPLAGRHPLGTYCYHADMKGMYGDIWIWQKNYRGYLENNRWYCVEQYLNLNQLDRNDGVLRAWIDGQLAFEKTDIRFRVVDRLRIEQVWMNVYHGGGQPSPYNQHLFIDQVVIAKQYIGPLGQ